MCRKPIVSLCDVCMQGKGSMTTFWLLGKGDEKYLKVPDVSVTNRTTSDAVTDDKLPDVCES